MLWYNSGNYYMGDAMGDANNDRVYESKLHEAKLIFRRSSVDHKKEKHNFNSNVDQFTERK